MAEEPGGPQSMGHKEADRTEQLSTHAYLMYRQTCACIFLVYSLRAARLCDHTDCSRPGFLSLPPVSPEVCCTALPPSRPVIRPQRGGDPT